MKKIIVYLIIISIFSLVVIAQPECVDGMTQSMEGGNSFQCHLTKCETLGVKITIDPYQNMTDTVQEYSLNPECNPINPLPSVSTYYPNNITFICNCIDDYTFTLTTLFNSDGIYYIYLTQNYTEIIEEGGATGGGGGSGGGDHDYVNRSVTEEITPTPILTPTEEITPAEATPPTVPTGPTGMATVTGAATGFLKSKPAKGAGIIFLILVLGIISYYIYKKRN